MNAVQQAQAAREFAKYWKNAASEKGDTQRFWMSLLRDVLGAKQPEQFIAFERQVKDIQKNGKTHTLFIDGYIEKTHVLIEQKGPKVDLSAPIQQSDGSVLTPYQQAKRYGDALPYDERPRWIVTCNFREFQIHDMNRALEPPEVVKLAHLGRESHRLRFLVDDDAVPVRHEMEISIKAGEIVGNLYDALRSQYNNPDSAESLHSLNVLCVRLVFLLYAENSGILGPHGIFHNYLARHRVDARQALIRLFEVLDIPKDKRAQYDPYLDDDLDAFPYVNGGLFRDQIEIPKITSDIVNSILHDASEGFDWSNISPTIFGAIFESTLNQETRDKGGMHYTSPENIHRVIDPLFLNELQEELDQAAMYKQESTRRKYLTEFRHKLASLKFFDPACGSGNFLTETYLSLRRLENEAVRIMTHDQIGWGLANPIEVSISQFYGCEINDFACTVAQAALWIAEAQMQQETERILSMEIEYLPLTTAAHIVEGNALRRDWNDIVPASEVSYVMGNLPFSGARIMTGAKKRDVLHTFGDGWKNVGNLDYVTCWFKKAADYITGTKVRVAFVATNSITQGESVANLWKPLFAEGVHIDFAWRTFRWDSEAKAKAHVHVVVVGFSKDPTPRERVIYTADGSAAAASNINGYLLDGPNVCVESRNRPICNAPPMDSGNQPIDHGQYLFTPQDMEFFIAKEPASAKFFRPWYGADEFVKGKRRYCLWLGDCPPEKLRHMPECMKRVNAVREFRLASKRVGTRKLAERPTRFQVESFPRGPYVAIPHTSSENRRYIPMGHMESEAICSNLMEILPDAGMYEFGILTSSVHMAWMRAVSGRLKSDYRYTVKIVYNNFPWPNPTPAQRTRIEETAKAILDARSLYPEATFADLYDEVTMPPELRKAHQENDKAVLQAYGMRPVNPVTDAEWDKLDADCAAQLFRMYEEFTKDE